VDISVVAVAATTDALTLTEYAATVNAETSFTATTDVLTLTAYSTTIIPGDRTIVSAATVSLTLTEYSADVNAETSFTATTDVLTLTTYEAVVTVGTVYVAATTDTLTLTVNAADVNFNVSFTGTTDALALTEYAADVDLDVSFTATTDELTVTTYSVTVVFQEWKKLAWEDDTVLKTEYDATSFLYATADSTPEAKTPTQVKTILGLGSSNSPTFAGLTLGAVYILVGTGSPENVVTGTVGSIFLRSDGGAGISMYVKESGEGNTGWVGK